MPPKVYVVTRKLPSGNVQLFLRYYLGRGRYGKNETWGILPKDKRARKEMMDAAQAVANKINLRYRTEPHGVPAMPARDESFLLFMRGIAEGQKKPATRTSWNYSIDRLVEFAGPEIHFGQVDRDFLERFAAKLISGYAPGTARAVFGKVTSTLRRAAIEGKIGSNPASTLRVKFERKGKRLITHLTLTEIRAMIETPISNLSTRNAFLFSCFSGLRWSDVEALSWNQIQDGFVIFDQKKTGEGERLPLSEAARQILEEQRGVTASPRTKKVQTPGRVFPLPTRWGVTVLLKNWAKAAGITKRVSFHTGRHSFAVMSITSGNDLYVTSKLLGHRDLSSTAVYARVVDETKVAAVSKMPKP